MEHNQTLKQRNYAPIIITLTIVINGLIALLFFIPKQNTEIAFDLTILPRLNAVFNSFTFIFLLAALFFILRKNVKMHRNFIFASFTSTFLFLFTYLTYHYLAPCTSHFRLCIFNYFYHFLL